jgi:hypothetical protein
MLKIEEYIARRKKEDKLNEYDTTKRSENTRVCVNYIFEYFNDYLDISQADEKTLSENEKIEKYRKQLREYDSDVQDWLISIFVDHGKYFNRTISGILKENVYYFLYNSEQDFRSISYECYSKLVTKNQFLKDQTEMLFLFIKNNHRIISQDTWRTGFPFVSENINQWIEETKNKFNVNLVAFARNWVDYFYDHEEIWPANHRTKSHETWRKYEYDIKKGSNLFNIDSLYIKMPKKPYTRGKKQEFEILMMYFWLHEIVGDDQNYWQEYLDKVLKET